MVSIPSAPHTPHPTPSHPTPSPAPLSPRPPPRDGLCTQRSVTIISHTFVFASCKAAAAKQESIPAFIPPPPTPPYTPLLTLCFCSSHSTISAAGGVSKAEQTGPRQLPHARSCFYAAVLFLLLFLRWFDSKIMANPGSLKHWECGSTSQEQRTNRTSRDAILAAVKPSTLTNRTMQLHSGCHPSCMTTQL